MYSETELVRNVESLPRYDVAVAYRVYPGVSKPSRGLPFDDDKLHQAEICLGSFKKSLGSLRVKIWAILDGCPSTYEDMFRRYFDPEDLVIVNTQKIGNASTFAEQMNILLSQSDADAVYFAEDDYVYMPDSFHLLLDFLHNGKDVQFVTAFDHPDYYDLRLHDFPKWLQIYENYHWCNAASTCLTFLTTKKLLMKYETVFRSYEKRNYDVSLWLSITKYRIFNPGSWARYALKLDKSMLYVLAKSWLYNWNQNLFGQQAHLWAPIPSIALHLDRYHVAPGFDLATQMHVANQYLHRPDC